MIPAKEQMRIDRAFAARLHRFADKLKSEANLLDLKADLRALRRREIAACLKPAK